MMQGIEGTERIWMMLNAPFASVLPGVDTNAFFAQHKVGCFGDFFLMS